MIRRARLPMLLAAFALSGAGGAQAWGQEATSEIVVDDPRITEASGLSLSPTHPNLLYTVNDSGNDPVVYVIDQRTGKVVGTTDLIGPDPEGHDIEAMSVDGQGMLWVADTGDNDHERTDAALYRLPAPRPGPATVTARRFPLRYPSGNPNIEALLIDPTTRRSWLITKEILGGEVLRLPDQMTPERVVTPEPVGGVRIKGLVTDATVLADGSAAVVRTYDAARVYQLPSWSQVGAFRLPRQQQGESLTSLPSGRTLLAGSEGSPALIDVVPVPQRILDALADDPGESPDPSGAASAGSEAAVADDTGPLRQALTWLVVGTGGLLVVAAATLVVRIRRGRE